MLDDRKLKILFAIIDSYISTSEPIGSRTIAKNYDLEVSSATIRNEMSDLEDLGFLNKAYSSSGRIPSQRAFRFYVNKLFDDGLVNIKSDLFNIDDITDDLDMEAIMYKTGKLITQATDYITATMVEIQDKFKVLSVDCIEVLTNSYLLVMVLDNGRVIDKVFNTNIQLDKEDLLKINNSLKKNLVGARNDEILKKIELIREENKKLKESLFDNIKDQILNISYDGEVLIEGFSKIFNFPEYKDYQTAKNLINYLEHKENIIKMFEEFSNFPINVRIGNENENNLLVNNSVIFSRFDLGKGVFGNIAVIGPVRMNYEMIIRTLYNFNDSINDILNGEKR